MCGNTLWGAGMEPRIEAQVRELSNIFLSRAGDVDRSAAFPEENFRLIRETQMLGLLVPREYGGLGYGVAEVAAVCEAFAEGCTSTAMLWAMHCQQVAVLVEHATTEMRDSVLPKIASGEWLVASVTTEPGSGGYLFAVGAALHGDGEIIHVRRDAPVVSAGLDADAYLVTMRSSPDSNPDDVSLVLVERDATDLEQTSTWDAMGMRGTDSVGLRIRARMRSSAIVGEIGQFRHIAVSTLIPVGHIVWSAVWLGAAKGAFRRVIRHFRDPVGRPRHVGSELTSVRIGDIRLKLESVSSFLDDVIAKYLDIQGSETHTAGAADARFQISSNGVKVLASTLCYQAVDELMQVCGVSGYYTGSGLGLERVLRDLRSASIMYSNERLLIANGKLSLLETSGLLSGLGTSGESDRHSCSD